MDSVTKRDLVDRIAERTKQKRTVVRQIAQELLNAITDELQSGHRIELRDFGVFEPVFRPRKVAQNPKTLERVTVEPKYSVKFRPGRRMKNVVAEGMWAQSELDKRTGENGESETLQSPTPTQSSAAEVVIREVDPPVVHTIRQPSTDASSV